MLKRIAIFLVILVAVTSVWAADMEVRLDPGATSITFELKATMHTVHGTARLKQGWIQFDPSTGLASGEIVVDATSADTGNGSRDKKMHNKVIRSADFPEIVLRPQRIEGELKGEGASEVTILGTMELVGTSHQMRIPLRVDIEDGRLSVEGRFAVPYVEWGLKNPSTFLLRVSKEVDVVIAATGTIVQPSEGSENSPASEGVAR